MVISSLQPEDMGLLLIFFTILGDITDIPSGKIILFSDILPTVTIFPCSYVAVAVCPISNQTYSKKQLQISIFLFAQFTSRQLIEQKFSDAAFFQYCSSPGKNKFDKWSRLNLHSQLNVSDSKAY